MKSLLFLCLLLTLFIVGIHAWDCDRMENYFTVNTYCLNEANMNMPYATYDKAWLKDYIEKMCSIYYPDYVTCMNNNMTSCTQIPSTTKQQWLASFSGRICQGTSLKQEYTNMMDTLVDVVHDALNSRGCLAKLLPGGMLDTVTCYADSFNAVGFGNVDLRSFEPNTVVKGMEAYEKVARNFLRCYRREIREKGTCEESKMDAVMAYIMHSLQRLLPPGVNIDEKDLKAKVAVELRKGKRQTVAAFGDPHIRTFLSGWMTCKGAGLWTTYLDNAYLKIEGYNMAACSDCQATVINKLKISLKDMDTVKANYTINDGALKNKFDDGKTEVDYGSNGKVVISSVDKLVKIKHSESGSLVFISSYAPRKMYPVLLVRLSESLLSESMGMLIEGCSTGIDITQPTGRRKRATTACENACSSISGKLKETCEYDCTTTGDTELPKSTASDMEEAEREAEKEDVDMLDNGCSTIISLVTLYLVVMGHLASYV